MAKPKVQVLVEVRSRTIADVYVDNAERHLLDVYSIEGVTSARVMNGIIGVIIDPRYDVNEIAAEVEELLNAEVPEVFKDAGR